MSRTLVNQSCFAIICLITACSSNIPNQTKEAEKTPTDSLKVETQVLPTHVPDAPKVDTKDSLTPENNSPIRKIDFSNFTFPLPKGFATDTEKTFTLKDGEKKRQNEDDVGEFLGRISYGDLTSDAEDDAVVTIYEEAGGNGTATIVFVYTMQKKKPKLLESFAFDWGSFVRNAFAESDQLVIENYQLCEGGDACCCPSFYWISRYQWQDGKFSLRGEHQKILLKVSNKNPITDNP